ncbi:MAG TPA: hypothetical protein VGA77_06295 [Propylenella sp.]
MTTTVMREFGPDKEKKVKPKGAGSASAVTASPWAEAARLAALKSVSEHLDRGGRLLLSYCASLTDARLIERAEATERRAELFA